MKKKIEEVAEVEEVEEEVEPVGYIPLACAIIVALVVALGFVAQSSFDYKEKYEGLRHNVRELDDYNGNSCRYKVALKKEPLLDSWIEENRDYGKTETDHATGGWLVPCGTNCTYTIGNPAENTQPTKRKKH